MGLTVIKNWDKNNWLASEKYILSFNKFLLKFKKLNSESYILDIGCGRGKIAGSLSTKLKLKNKPIGIDLVSHPDKDRRINFKRIDAVSFFYSNKKKFDLILIKQTIHLLKFYEIKNVLNQCKKVLKPNGKIFIFTLNPYKNEFPIFKLMKKKLQTSLNRDKKIISFISKLYPKRNLKNFSFRVIMSKKRYISIISKKFISTLLTLNKNQILSGIKEIDLKYKKNLRFTDKLICIIIKNN